MTDSTVPQSTVPESTIQVDPITQEVITEGLVAIMAEMRANVMRAAYSTLIALLNDFSCGLFDPSGQLIAQGPDHPGHIVPLPWGVRSCMEDLGDSLEPGDVVLLNDPYRGGTHLNDVTVLYPVFAGGRLFCFPAVRAHWGDVGGISPGSYSGEATNIFYEGIRIPPIKIVQNGSLNRSALDLIMANVRLPRDREGDLLACIGACRTGERRIGELRDKYGEDVFLAAVANNLVRSERRMRGRIAELPDGSYYAEDYLEFFTGGRLDPGRIALRLDIAGDEITADFTESSDQLPGVVNSTAAVTLAGVVIAVKSALDPGGAINAGSMRPVNVLTRPGTLVDVVFDAPANAHGEVRKRVVGVTLAALAQVAPERVSADLCGTSYANSIGGWDALRQSAFVYTASPAGGNGATRDTDGASALGNVDMGSLPLNFPAEEQESVFPVLIEEIAIRPDSEGAGRQRGGLGAIMRITMRAAASRVEYSLTCDRAVIPPWGIVGGEAAAPVLNLLEHAGAATEAFHLGKVSSYPLSAEDSLVLHAAGGGGYGDPLDRDPNAVAADVVNGYVSRARAADVYGVVLADDGEPSLEDTVSRRAGLRAKRVVVALREGEFPAYEGTRGSHRVQSLSPAIAEMLHAAHGDLIEMAPAAGAPLRAWVRIAPDAPDDCVVIDARGLLLLKSAAGEPVELRVPRTLNSANDQLVRTGRVRPAGRPASPA
jgi:N-methylhydantoinase B